MFGGRGTPFGSAIMMAYRQVAVRFKQLLQQDVSLLAFKETPIYPYARKYGAYGNYSGMGSTYFWQVHRNTGELYRSAFRRTRWVSRYNLSCVVGLDPTKSPHVSWVIEGTEYMIARPVVEASLSVHSKELSTLLNTALFGAFGAFGIRMTGKKIRL